MSDQRTIKGLVLEPLDVLLFRGGRPLEAGYEIQSMLPTPQVFAGAVRTTLLDRLDCDYNRLAEGIRQKKSFQEALRDTQSPEVAEIGQIRMRGLWLARNGKDGVEPLVSLPLSLARNVESGELLRLDPLKSVALPGWDPPGQNLLPLWSTAVKRVGKTAGFLTLAGLRVFLDGGIPPEESVFGADRLFCIDRRVGIAVDPHSYATRKERIYAAGFLTLLPGVKIYGEVEGTRSILDLIPTQLPLGGEGHRVIVQSVDPVIWPEGDESKGAPVCVLLTPTPFNPISWCPPMLEGTLAAAAVGAPEALTGWDLARRAPKPTRYAVPAGSVYFLNQLPPSLPRSLCAENDALEGWGFFCKGVWNHV